MNYIYQEYRDCRFHTGIPAGYARRTNRQLFENLLPVPAGSDDTALQERRGRGKKPVFQLSRDRKTGIAGPQ